MSRGMTWGREEVQALIEIWSDDNVSRLLSTTHKNTEVFEMFSEKMAAQGFRRSAQQCRIKVKKLRQQYIKVRDALRKGASSEEEKEKFMWYDDLDAILGVKSSSHVVESFKEEAPWTPISAEPADLFGELEKIGDQHEDEESSSSSVSPKPQPKQKPCRPVIPGAQSRKRKTRADRLDGLLETYMDQIRQMDEADQKRHDEEKAAFENFFRQQREAEERRFQALQEQQQANTRLLLHMMETFAKAVLPQSHNSPSRQPPTAPTVSLSGLPPHNPPGGAETSGHPSPSTSSSMPYGVKPLRGMGSSGSAYIVKPLGVQGQQNLPEYSSVSREEIPGAAPYRPDDTHQDGGDTSPAAKRRLRSSGGPIIVIKDEPVDRSYVQANQRASLPDSTGDQPHVSTQVPEKQPGRPQHPQQRAVGEPCDVSCDVCLTGGELQRCHKCPRAFHLSCHVPTLHKPPSGEWFCSFCRDPSEPETDYESSPEAITVKIEPDSEGGFAPEDKRKCERLLLHLFCSDLGSDSGESESPSVCANSRPTVKGAMKFSTVKKRLEATQSPSYQSPAEFVSDIRLVLNSTASSEEADRKLKEVFEEHLSTIFPDQIFPEIKLEMTPSSPVDFHLSSLEDISQPAKRPRLCSDGEEATP